MTSSCFTGARYCLDGGTVIIRICGRSSPENTAWDLSSVGCPAFSLAGKSAFSSACEKRHRSPYEHRPALKSRQDGGTSAGPSEGQGASTESSALSEGSPRSVKVM